MAGRSKIAILTPELKDAVDRLIRKSRTIREIVEYLNGMGEPVSMSAVGRYKKSAEEEMQAYKRSQAIAAVWAEKIGEDRTSAVGDAAMQLLNTVAFQASKEMVVASDDENAEQTDLKALKLVTESIRNLAQAGKLRADQERAVRQIVREEQAAQLAELERDAARAAAAGDGKGLDPDMWAKVRRTILGV
jgi:hypothetical protein